MKLQKLRLDYAREALFIVAAMGVGVIGTYTHWTIPLILAAGGLFTLLLLQRPVLGVFLIAFFLPFERIGSIDVGGITVRIHQLLAMGTLGAWVMSGLLRKKWRIPLSEAYFPLLIFLAAAGIGYLNAPNPGRSMALTGFTGFTIFAGMVLPGLIRTREHLETFLKYLLMAAFAVSLFGLYQFFGDFIGIPHELTGLRAHYTKDVLGFPRVQSTALEPLYFANYLMIPLFITLALFLSKQKLFTRWKLLALTVLFGVNIFMTVSRGAYIALAVGLVVLAAFYLKRLLNPVFGFALAAAGGIAIFVGSRLLEVQDVFDKFLEHTVNIFSGASFVERADTFIISIEKWLQHPWFGYGIGSFGPLASHHPFNRPNGGWAIVNNEYLELLVETGLIGLIAFLSFVVILLWNGWVKGRKMDAPFTQAVTYGLIAALIATLVQYNTFSILYIMHIWIMIGVLHRLTAEPLETS